jgi:hypothetical protein
VIAVIAALGVVAGLMATPASAVDPLVEPDGPVTFTIIDGEVAINSAVLEDPIPLGCDPEVAPPPGEDPCNPSTMSGDIDDQGNVVIPQSGVVFPVIEARPPEAPIAIDIQMAATGPSTGVLDPAGGTASINVPLQAGLTFNPGTPGAQPCAIALNMNLTGTYDQFSGIATVTDTFDIGDAAIDQSVDPAGHYGMSCAVESLIPFFGAIIGLPASGNTVEMVIRANPVITQFIPDGPPSVGDAGAVTLGLGGSATRNIPVLAKPALDSLVVVSGGDLASSVSIALVGNVWRITYVHDADAGPGTDTIVYEGDNGLGTDTGTLVVHISGNECQAGEPGEPATGCSLDQFIEFDILGDVMTMSQEESNIELEEITLDGKPQVTTGSMNQITVINRRGDGASWNVTGQVTDFKVEGLGSNCPASNQSTWRFDCIPGSNLGWTPIAAVAHQVVPGDVAKVDAGSDILASAIAAGLHTNDGLGTSGNSLCSSPATQSGGSFVCDAGLTLTVPASAAAGTYQATLTLTLL